MEIFRNRPLALVCCLFAFASLLAVKMNAVLLLCASLSALVLSLLLLCIWLIRKYKWSFLGSCCAAAVFLATLSSLFFFHIAIEPYRPYLEREVKIEGTVLERSESTPYSSLLEIEVTAFEGEACKRDATLTCEYASALQTGDRFCATVTLTALEPMNFLCSDFRRCEILEERSDSMRVWFLQRNADLNARLLSAVGGEEGRLASALLLGNREELTGETPLQFQRTGISHLLALSGLHVSILAALADLLLKWFRCPRVGRAIVVAILGIFYLLLTGCSPSAARAVCMVCLVTLSLCVQEEYDSFTALSVALALLLLLSPAWVTDLRLWMSFTAAGAIVIFMPLLSTPLEALYQKWTFPLWTYKVVAYFISGLFIGIVANLAMLPILALFIGNTSLLSVPTTLLLSVPMTLTLVFAILALLVPPLGFLCHGSAHLMLWLAEAFSKFENILVPLNDPFTLTVVMASALALVLLAVLKWKRPLLLGIIPLALSVLAIATSFGVTQILHNGVTAHYIHESGGEVVLFTERGQAVAFDFSDGSADGAYTLTTVAKDARCTEIDDLVITHYHNQATHFISTVASAVKVQRIRLSPPQNDWERSVAMRMQEVAARYGISVSYDLDGLAVSTVQTDVGERQTNDTDLHPALLYSWQINGQRLTYLNCSVVGSPYEEKAEILLQDTEVLLVGSTGYSTVLEQILPYTPKSDITAIALAEERLHSVLPFVPTGVTISVNLFPLTFPFP